MKVRCVKSAFVSVAFLAAIAMSCGTSLAQTASASATQAREAYATLQKGDAAGAIGLYTAAIDNEVMAPEAKANALLNRALAYQQVGQHQQAIDDYTVAFSLDVMSASLRSTAHYNRGLSQHKLGQLPLAVEDFTSALLLNPQFPQAFLSRGNALRDSGQLLFALSDYERALRFKHPDPAIVYFASATTYLTLKRPQDAKKALNAALALKPDFGQARAQLIMLGDENAKLETAESDPILTGSIAAIAGGTTVTKPDLPVAVEPPEVLLTAAATPIKKKKRYLEPLPETDDDYTVATTASITPVNEEIVAIEQVPEIPAPIKRVTTAAVAAPADEPEEMQVASAAPAAEDVSDQPMSAWTVQVASANSEDAAWSTWKKMQKRFKVLKSQSPLVVKADLGTKGVVYRVRLGGYDDQAAAKSACGKLKSNGVDCYISKSGT